jgi:hypothetical protein
MNLTEEIGEITKDRIILHHYEDRQTAEIAIMEKLKIDELSITIQLAKMR